MYWLDTSKIIQDAERFSSTACTLHSAKIQVNCFVCNDTSGTLGAYPMVNLSVEHGCHDNAEPAKQMRVVLGQFTMAGFCASDNI